MPRVGQNPARWSSTRLSRAEVWGATIVHIPDLVGYWAGSFEVLKACLESFFRTAPGVPLHLFDNASHSAIREYLLELSSSGAIERLTLSRENVGKVGGWNVLLGGAESDYVAYFDSDVLFLPGWIELSLEIARAFPEAGMITAQPIVGGDLRRHWTARQAKAATLPTQIEEGTYVPERFIRAHLTGIGAPNDAFESRQRNRVDVRLGRAGIHAYATASHFQFVTPSSVLRRLFPATTEQLLGDDLQFDREMETLGFWRLSTIDYLVHHLGNHLGDIRVELPWVPQSHLNYAGGSPGPRPRSRGGLLMRLARRELPRRWMKRLASALHELLAATGH